MKKLIVSLLVLGLTTTANAELKITVDGVIDPPAMTVAPGTSLTVGIYNTEWGYFTTGSTRMSFSGGSYDITGATNNVNPPGYPVTIFPVEAGVIYVDLVVLWSPPPGPLPSGQLVDQILVHPDGPGDMTIIFFDELGEFGVLDTQIIHVPEPMTLALFGLGGLLLRKQNRR